MLSVGERPVEFDAEVCGSSLELKERVVYLHLQLALCLPVVEVEHACQCLPDAELQPPVPQLCGHDGHVCRESCFNLLPLLSWSRIARSSACPYFLRLCRWEIMDVGVE